jgi:hypothetical protein
LRVGHGANNPSPEKFTVTETSEAVEVVKTHTVVAPAEEEK